MGYLTNIILNYQTHDLTIQCIESMLKTQSLVKYRIIIVDDCSPNGSYDYLKKWISTKRTKISISLIQTKQNGGYSAALNCGVLEAVRLGTQYIAVLNNDLIFTENYFDILISNANDNPEIAFWGGSIIGADGAWQVAYKFYKSSLKLLLSKKPFALIFNVKSSARVVKSTEIKKMHRFFGMVSGCCFMFSVDLLSIIGLWDENIYLYYEEDAIAAKLFKQGLQCAVIPSASLIHLGSQTIGCKTPATYYNRYISELYVQKNYYKANRMLLFIFKTINIIGLSFNIQDKKLRKDLKKNLNSYYRKLITSKDETNHEINTKAFV